MGDQENREPISKTPASKKRTFGNSMAPHDNSLQKDPVTKKRVALGDLTNTPGFTVDQNFAAVGVTKEQTKKTTKENKVVEEVAREKEAVSSPDDPQNYLYAPLIYQHLHLLEMEENRRPLPDYIERIQSDVTASMRGILVDWLVEVAEEYKLHTDTLYLTVSYVDRFLSSHTLNRTKLQLLGVSSMLVASKYEEISLPHVEDFCYITDNTYTKDEVVNMERDVLKFLNFEMGSPTTKTFLRIFTRAAQDNFIFNNLQFEFLSSYLAELSLLDYNCVWFLPSLVASSAIFLAAFIIQPNTYPWSLALEQSSGYRPPQLKQCVLAIHNLQLGRRGASLEAVRHKYLQHKFNCVATLPAPSEIPPCYFEDING